MPRQFWILKTEPTTYSYDQLVKDSETFWNGIRNFQARNYLRTAQRGDLALIYHSGKDKAVVGIAEIVSAPMPESDPKDPGDWIQVKIRSKKKLKTPVTLAALKATKTLQGLLLLKQSRLSVSPVTEEDYQTIVSLGGAS